MTKLEVKCLNAFCFCYFQGFTWNIFGAVVGPLRSLWHPLEPSSGGLRAYRPSAAARLRLAWLGSASPHPKAPPRHPKGSPDYPRTPQGTHRAPQDTPKAPPRVTPRHPRVPPGPLEAPPRHPRGSPRAPQDTCDAPPGNQCMIFHDFQTFLLVFPLIFHEVTPPQGTPRYPQGAPEGHPSPPKATPMDPRAPNF